MRDELLEQAQTPAPDADSLELEMCFLPPPESLCVRLGLVPVDVSCIASVMTESCPPERVLANVEVINSPGHGHDRVVCAECELLVADLIDLI